MALNYEAFRRFNTLNKSGEVDRLLARYRVGIAGNTGLAVIALD